MRINSVEMTKPASSFHDLVNILAALILQCLNMTNVGRLDGAILSCRLLRTVSVRKIGEIAAKRSSEKGQPMHALRVPGIDLAQSRGCLSHFAAAARRHWRVSDQKKGLPSKGANPSPSSAP
jgi:hypothetical protein